MKKLNLEFMGKSHGDRSKAAKFYNVINYPFLGTNVNDKTLGLDIWSFSDMTLFDKNH